jgi:hypothetical protein
MASEPHFSGLHQAAAPSMMMRQVSNNRKAPIFFVFAAEALEYGKPEQMPQESASPQGRKPAVRESDITGEPCHSDFEEGEVANCLYQTATGQLFVAPGSWSDCTSTHLV